MSYSLSGTVGATTLTATQIAAHTHTLTNNAAMTLTPVESGAGFIPVTQGDRRVALGTKTSGGSGSHTHSISTTSGATSSLPPYYALAWIMRCA